jgi:DNA mismatch repair protein MutS
MNLSDLNVESELIPFFDINLNRHSREALASFFNTFPKTAEAVEERQQVLAAFTANCNSIKMLPSYKADIEEAYEFCQRLERHLPDSESKFRNFRIMLFFSRKDREWFLSRSVQILLLFEKIYQHYFYSLDVSVFPSPYRDSVRNLIDLVSAFAKERASLIEKGNYLSGGEVAGFLQKLFVLNKDGRLVTWWHAFFLFEAYLSIAVTSKKSGFVPARFIDKGIRLTGLFHPFIKNPVKNNIHIDKNVFVLTGPNMSGKSTLLRSISLCVYLARLGLPVPASECELFFADDINVFINARDNLNSGYSHFMTEILNLKDSIVAAGEEKQVFAVFDELFSGTNIDDALNILTITINGLKKFNNSFFLLSTHFYKLKELHVDEMSHAAFYYVDSFLENGVPKFTYQVKAGWSDIKFGSILFEREGLTQLLK